MTNHVDHLLMLLTAFTVTWCLTSSVLLWYQNESMVQWLSAVFIALTNIWQILHHYSYEGKIYLWALSSQVWHQKHGQFSHQILKTYLASERKQSGVHVDRTGVRRSRCSSLRKQLINPFPNSIILHLFLTKWQQQATKHQWNEILLKIKGNYWITHIERENEKRKVSILHLLGFSVDQLPLCEHADLLYLRNKSNISQMYIVLQRRTVYG